MADVGGGVRKPAGDISEMIETRARQAYAVREILYPTGQALTYAAGGSDKEKIDNPYAAEFVRNWVYTDEVPGGDAGGAYPGHHGGPVAR